MPSKFIPEAGKLVLSFLVGSGVNEVNLQYRHDQDDGERFQVIARMTEFQVHPHFCAVRGGNFTGFTVNGNAIAYKTPADSELEAFGKLWNSERTLQEWLQEVKSLQGLATPEVNRLSSLLQKFI